MARPQVKLAWLVNPCQFLAVKGVIDMRNLAVRVAQATDDKPLKADLTRLATMFTPLPAAPAAH